MYTLNSTEIKKMQAENIFNIFIDKRLKVHSRAVVVLL